LLAAAQPPGGAHHDIATTYVVIKFANAGSHPTHSRLWTGDVPRRCRKSKRAGAWLRRPLTRAI